MPHLERKTPDGNWIELEGTKHNYDPNNKSKRAQMAHGIMADTEGIREVPDSAGKICSYHKPVRTSHLIYEPNYHVGTG